MLRLDKQTNKLSVSLVKITMCIFVRVNISRVGRVHHFSVGVRFMVYHNINCDIQFHHDFAYQTLDGLCRS